LTLAVVVCWLAILLSFGGFRSVWVLLLGGHKLGHFGNKQHDVRAAESAGEFVDQKVVRGMQRESQ
jgi:hypothetical protein